MDRSLKWSIGSALAIIAGGVVMAITYPAGPVLIPGDKPVTEDQVREKLQTDGWSNIQIRREGRYFEAVASKNGQSSRIDVDSQTGRLSHLGDGDDD